MQSSAIASATIYPCRFVKKATADSGMVTQCGAGERPFGISQRDIRRNDYVETSGRAALVNEPIGFYIEPEECLLELGGTVTAGDYLKSDANGKGVTADTDQDDYGAVAIVSGTSGQQVRVKVRIGERSTS
jgi:hypothetical protein